MASLLAACASVQPFLTVWGALCILLRLAITTSLKVKVPALIFIRSPGIIFLQGFRLAFGPSLGLCFQLGLCLCGSWSRPRLPWLLTCPAQRLAQLENALPPLFLRKGLRLRQSQQRPPSEDGSTPASTSFYMTRGGVLRTPKTSWPRPRHNWSLSLDVTYLNASGYYQKDAISLGSCRHFGRGSAFALDDASICYRRILQRTPVQGLLGPPMFKAPGQRRQLPLTPGHMLLVDGREWRRGSVDRLVKTFLYFLGSRPLCFRSSLCLHPSEERLALTAPYDSIISVLRCPVRLPFPMDGATFSSHMPRNAGLAQLPLVRDAAIRLHDYGRRPGKDSALSYLQDPARMQTRLYTPSRIGPRLHFCLCLRPRFPLPLAQAFFFWEGGVRIPAALRLWSGTRPTMLS